VHICLITDKPDHPVMAPLAAELRTRHRVRFLYPSAAAIGPTVARAEMDDLADLYLLRAHDTAGLNLGRRLERSGALLINSSRATGACLDRMATSERARAARLPWPDTWAISSLEAYLDGEIPPHLPYPLVVKSRRSSRGDLVRRVDSRVEMEAVAASSPMEPVIVQPYLPNDGLDRKLYAVDGIVFGVCRPSPMSEGDPERRVPMWVPVGWARLANEVGRTFGLRAFGLDLVLSDSGPMIVDVNPFPGYRGAPEAPRALVDMIERTAAEKGASP
jgi:ribosomal protein S6--L-glutamate ligase